MTQAESHMVNETLSALNTAGQIPVSRSIKRAWIMFLQVAYQSEAVKDPRHACAGKNKTNQQSNLFFYEAEAWEALKQNLGISLAWCENYARSPSFQFWKGVVKLHTVLESKADLNRHLVLGKALLLICQSIFLSASGLEFSGAPPKQKETHFKKTKKFLNVIRNKPRRLSLRPHYL